MIVSGDVAPSTRTGLLAKVGLTFTGWQGVGKSWGFALFGFFFVGTDFATKTLIRSTLADDVLDAMPVPVERVPFLVAASLMFLALGTGLAVIALLGLLSPTGYDNNQPRVMKSVGLAQSFPTPSGCSARTRTRSSSWR